MAHVFRQWGTAFGERSVKNLGWLLEHAREAQRVVIRGNGIGGNEATLLVVGKGWVFYCPFGSRQVLTDWLQRRRTTLAELPTDVDYSTSVTLNDLRKAFTEQHALILEWPGHAK